MLMLMLILLSLLKTCGLFFAHFFPIFNFSDKQTFWKYTAANPTEGSMDQLNTMIKSGFAHVYLHGKNFLPSMKVKKEKIKQNKAIFQ